MNKCEGVQCEEEENKDQMGQRDEKREWSQVHAHRESREMDGKRRCTVECTGFQQIDEVAKCWKAPKF